MVSDDLIRQASSCIRSSKQLTALTGAGVSKESGIPTFRDALDGLWARYDPTQLATRRAFTQDSKLVWDFYEYRRELMRPAQPNPGHYALAALQARLPHARIITQNVDTLHEQAGSAGVIRLHGNIFANKCINNCQGEPTSVDVALLDWDRASGPPSCPHCGSPVRPDVVWFGEMLPPDQLQAAYNLLIHTDVLLVVGTSGLVSPAADMPYYARASGASIIEINPGETPISGIADIKLSGHSGDILPRLVEAL
jgi:NAD-dependent deacetylase